LKRLAFAVVKIGLSLAIVAYLIVKAKNDRAFAELAEQPKNWGLLGLACAAFLAALLVTHVRWCYLVRGLDLPFRMRDAFRLGFLGYLFNLAPAGIVGGDLLKGVMLVRQLNGHRAKATASVLVDRVIGLYVLFLVASVAILATGYYRQVVAISVACLAVTVAGGVLLMAVFAPGPVGVRIATLAGQLPRIGRPLEQLLITLRLYHRCLPMLAVTAIMTVAVHLLNPLGLYLIGCGLYDRVLPFSTQVVVVSLAASTSVIPLPLGPFEVVLEFLYCRSGMPLHQGLIVALAFRIATLLLAVIGMVYYVASRDQVAGGLSVAEPLDAFALSTENSSHAA
jgi:glycosyltransferase 2 family protein